MVDYRAGIANTQNVSEHLVVSEDKKSAIHTHTHTHTFFLSLSVSHTHAHTLFLSLKYVRRRRQPGSK